MCIRDRAVGKEALRAGMNIMTDVASSGTPVRESFKNRVKESGKNLKRKAEEKIDKLMEGSGYKYPRRMIRHQLLESSSGVNKRVSVKRKAKIKRLTRAKNKTKKKPSKQKKKKKQQQQQQRRKKKIRTTRDIFN